MDGRWPMVSGIKFSFDAKKPAGERLIKLTKANGDEIV